jgi:CRISPR type III-A-associated RAMP protein Csm4
MALALLVRMRPTSPWRTGPSTGARERVDTLYHSDSLYSAVTHALQLLGHGIESWLDATARNPEGSAVRFSSAFPLFAEHLLVVPPHSAWPPPPSAKMRWKGARYVPLALIPGLLSGTAVDDDQWTVDGASECLVPSGQGGPFRTAVRSSAAVDRLNGNTLPHSSACLEFQSGGGLWFVATFADDAAREQWEAPIQAAVRLLADSGFGGERARGWGRAAAPAFTSGELSALLFEGWSETPASDHHWLLSLYSPAESDPVDWSKGNYSTVERGGWVESSVQSGAQKKRVRMIEEGSVLSSSGALAGRAPDVAPDGFPHPVFRAGFALSIPLPTGGAQ